MYRLPNPIPALTSFLKMWPVFFIASILFLIPYIYVSAEEFVVDPSIFATNSSGLTGAPAAVCVDDQRCFVFYLDAGGGISIASSTDGGVTWSSGSNVDSVNTTDAVSVGVWWEGWTPGTTTTRFIHIASTDTGDDDTYYTRYDIETNTLSTTVLGTTQVADCTRGADCYPAITMASDGALYMATAETSDRWVVRCTTDCTNAGNWTEIIGGFTGSNGDDYPILMPISGTNNILLTWWDISADTIYFNEYSATSTSWVYSSLQTVASGADDNTTYDAQLMGMAIATTTGEIALVFVDDANDYTTQDHDIKFLTYSTSTGWTNKTNPVTNTPGGITGAKVTYDPVNATWYVVYTRRLFIGTGTSGNIFYRYSTDGGTTWSAEKGPLNNVRDEINALTVNITGSDRLGVWWNYSTASFADQLFYSPLAAIDTMVTVSGTFYESDRVTPVGAGVTVKLALGSTTPSVHSTTTIDGGMFSIDVVADDPTRDRLHLTLYGNEEGETKAATLASVFNMDTVQNHMDLIADHVSFVPSAHQLPTTVSNFLAFSNTNDSDVPFFASSTQAIFSLSGANTLFVASGTTAFIDRPTQAHHFESATTSTIRASSTLELTGNFTQNGTLLSSADNIWVRPTVSGNYWEGIAYGKGLFVSVSDSATPRVITSPDGFNWTGHPAVSKYWQSIHFAGDLFFAFTHSGYAPNIAMTSPDGMNWTSRSWFNDVYHWQGVAYGDGVYVMVGGGPVAYSYDGLTWATTSTPASYPNSVIYSNGLFVAVGNDVMTSPDGINWTLRTKPISRSLTSITYGSGLFVAVSQYSSYGDTSSIMTSPDGINWTARPGVGTSGSWVSVTYGNGLFVAVGDCYGLLTECFMTSSDGINWTVKPFMGNNDSWEGVAYGNGTFVAVSWNPSIDRVVTSLGADNSMSFSGTTTQTISGNLTATSTLPNLRFSDDGVKIILNNASTSDLIIETSSGAVTALSAFSVAGNYENNSTFNAPADFFLTGHNMIATGTWSGDPNLTLSGGERTLYTPATTTNFSVLDTGTVHLPETFTIKGHYTNNGTTTKGMGVWVPHSAAGDNDGWTSVTYGNGLFVAVGYSGDRVMTSPDGKIWATTTAAGDNDSWRSVIYGNGLFVAVGSGPDRVMTSVDGITWATTTAAGDNDSWYSVIYGNGLFVAVGSGPDRVMTSVDGITWATTTAAGDNDSWYSVTYGNDLFVAVGVSGDRVMTSPDGIVWTARSAAGDNDSWYSVTYGNDLFVAVGVSGDRVMTSPDGITWTVRSAAGNNDPWTSVTYGNGFFVAVASNSGNNRLIYSVDGISWIPLVSNYFTSLNSVVYGNGLFAAVGEFGDRVITSSVSNLTFASTDSQSIAGTLTGTSSLGNITFRENGVKTFISNASTSDFTIESGATVAAPVALSVRGNIAQHGTFTANSGVVYLNATEPQFATGTLTGTSAFYDLTVLNQSTTTLYSAVEVDGTFTLRNPEGMVALPVSATTTVNNFNVIGELYKKVRLRSTELGVQAALMVTGTSSITYVDVQDSEVCGSAGGGIAISALQNTDSGNNDCWNFITYSFGEGVTVSGVLYQSDRITPVGTSQNIMVVVGDDVLMKYPVVSQLVTGVYSVTLPSTGIATGTSLTVFVDNYEPIRAVAVTKVGATSTIADLPLFVDHVVIRNEADPSTGTTIRVVDLVFDNTDDADILYTATGSTLTLAVNQSLYIASSTTLLGDAVVVPNNLYIASSSTYIASTSLTLGGDFINAGIYTTAGAVWQIASSSEANAWNAITHGNNLFIAVADDGTNRIMTSPNGLTWTARSITDNDHTWTSITHGNGRFVVVGTSSDRVAYSTNGTSWATTTAAGDNDAWTSVTYGNGLFVAVGQGPDYVMTSPDGIVWTARSAAGDNDAWTSVTYGNGLFVAVGVSGDRVMTSVDGITWATTTAAGDNDAWTSVTYGNGLFVAVGQGPDYVMTSPDGIVWTARSAAGDNDAWTSVTYGNGLFVAVGVSGDRVMTSPDGINWTARESAQANSWTAVTYGADRFVAVSNTGTNRVMTALDATTTLSGADQTLSGSFTGSSQLRGLSLSSGGTKTLAVAASTTNLSVASGVTFNTDEPLTIHGNVIDNGRVAADAVTFAGSHPQTIKFNTAMLGDVRFIDNGTKTFINASTTVRDVTIEQVSGNVTVATSTFTLTGSLMNYGLLDARTSTTTFAGIAQQTATGTLSGSSALGTVVITNPATTTFSTSLTVTGRFINTIPGSEVRLLSDATTTVGILRLVGANSNRIILRGTTQGIAANLVVATSSDIAYVRIQDISACGSLGGGITLAPSRNTDLGNNTCVTFLETLMASNGVIVSGVLYESDRVTPVATQRSIMLTVGGDVALTFGTTTAADTGAFSIIVPAPIATGTVLTLYTDNSPTLRASTITKGTAATGTEQISGIDLFKDHVTVNTTRSGTTTRSSDLVLYDGEDNNDIPFLVTNENGMNITTIEDGQTFYVASGTVFYAESPFYVDSFETATTAIFQLSTPLTITGDLYNAGTLQDLSTTTWSIATSSAAGNNDFWTSVTYGNGLFVAVGKDGDRVMTSPDGVNWTARSAAGNNDSWFSVTYGNGIFVAVGDSGDRVMTSPDGITWTARSAAGNDDSWTSVTYGNGLFVAVGCYGGATYCYQWNNVVGDRVMTSPDGVNWTVRSVFNNNDPWTSVTYGNGLFVAVGNCNDSSFYYQKCLMTSVDGINWIDRSITGNTGNWRSVTYGNGLFVAVSKGDNNSKGDRVMTSPDGITWTTRAVVGNNDYWNFVTYGNGLFVAVGEYYSNYVGNESLMTSPDGVNWTAQIPYNLGWTTAVYADGRFVVIRGNYTWSTANRVILSLGSSRSLTLSGTSTQTLNGNLSGLSTLPPLVFKESGTKTILDNASTTDFIIESSSGIVTANGTLSIAGNYHNTATFNAPTNLYLSGNSKEVIGSWSGAPNLVVSDGIRTLYNSATTTDFLVATTGTAFLPDTLTVLGDYITIGTTTNRGAVWTAVATSSAAGNDDSWTSVTYGNGRFVAVGYSGDLVMTSPDGFTWTAVATSSAAGNDDSWTSVTYGNGLFVAVGYSGDRVMTSPDGFTWTAVGTSSAAGNDDSWTSVTYGNGRFVAVGSSGDRVMYSSDGADWTAVATSSAAGNNDRWQSVTYGNGLFVAVACGPAYCTDVTVGDRVMTSPDGITWTARSAAGDDDSWYSVTYGNGLFVAVGNYYLDRVMTSPDGINWTARSAAGNNDSWTSVTYGNGLFVAVGHSGDRVMTSPDGINWTARSAAGDNDTWTSVTYGNGLFVVVGSSGDNRIMTSTGILTKIFSGTSPQTIQGLLTGRNSMENVVLGGGSQKTFLADALVSNMKIESGTTVVAPEQLTILGDYQNNGIFTAGNGTTTFAGSGIHTLSGNMTGDSSWETLAFTGKMVRVLESDVAVRNLINGTATTPFESTIILPEQLSITGDFSQFNIVVPGTGTTTFNGNTPQTATGTLNFHDLVLANDTASTTFGAPLFTTGQLVATTPGTLIELPSGATSTFARATIRGASGNEVKIRATTPGTQAGFALAGPYAITYADVQDSSGETLAGDIQANDGTLIDSGNNTGWNFTAPPPAPTISSDADQVFVLGQSSTPIGPIIISESMTPAVTIENDIYLRLATSTLNVRWDTTDTTATFSGTAAAKVSTTVSYEDSGATLVLDVTENFAGGDTLIISGLSYTNFTAVNTATSALTLYTGGSADETIDAYDDKTITITGSLTLSNHPEGQVTSGFSALSRYDIPLYRFTLTPAGEDMALDTITIDIQGANGVLEEDISNLRLYHDTNRDGAYDGGDILLDGTPTFALPGQSGTVTFTLSTTSTTTMDFLLLGDVSGINPSDQMNISLASTGIVATGLTTSASITVTGEANRVQHNRGGSGSRSIPSLAPVGGEAPEGDGIRTGGTQGGTQGEIDTNIGGGPGSAEMGDPLYYKSPTSGSGGTNWSNVPGGAYTRNDGLIAELDIYTSGSFNLNGFGLNIPSTNQILGIEVRIECRNGGSLSMAVQLSKGSSKDPLCSGTMGTRVLGGSTDLWGTTWTANEVNGMAVTISGSSWDEVYVSVDAVTVRVYHQATGGNQGGGGGEVRRPGLLPLAGTIITNRLNIAPHRRNVAYLLTLLGAKVDELVNQSATPQSEK